VPFRILCVCTGNICRSPTAERLLRHQFDLLLGADAAAFEVVSAGTGALVGEPIEAHAAALLEAADVDTSAFTARMLAEAELKTADLVLAMTRQHRAMVATLLPATLPRLFTLREFARLASASAPALPPRERVTDWARALVPAAAAKRGLVRGERAEDDDVVDPYGGPASGYREPFDLIAAATETIARALALPASAAESPRPEETV
jgi:protein-tyrosine phosphatase